MATYHRKTSDHAMRPRNIERNDVERSKELLKKRQPVQSRNAIRYVLATQEGCSPDEWSDIIKLAVRDAKDEEHFSRRASGRTFLAKMLMPSDPAQLLQVFAPQLKLVEINQIIQTLNQRRDALVEAGGSQPH